MDDSDNQNVINAINHTIVHNNWIGHLDNGWSWLRTLLPDTELYIKKVKNGILIDDFGMTLTEYDECHTKPIEKSKCFGKDFKDIIDMYNIMHKAYNDNLYVKVPMKDALVGISRMEQAIIRIQDLIQYK